MKNISRFIPTLKIPTVSRISLDSELLKQFKRLNPGVVLDAGSTDSPYKKHIPHTRYITLDIDERSKPDICCDIHDIKWQSNYFDTVIAIEVLEHLHDPQKAVNEIHRVIKKGGICIASTRFIYPYHPHPKDYFRYTWDSLNNIFKVFNNVEIFHHGNRVQALWQILSFGKSRVILNIFNPLIAKIKFKNTKFPLGFVVYAQK